MFLISLISHKKLKKKKILKEIFLKAKTYKSEEFIHISHQIKLNEISNLFFFTELNGKKEKWEMR